MDLDKLNEILKAEPPYRARQAYRAVFVNLIENWDEATGLPAGLRQRLADECPAEVKAEIYGAKNGKTVKAAFFFDRVPVEAVLMRHAGGRNTVCVSSQIGCALACDFCATGKIGFTRNLKYYEIIEQVLFFARFLKKRGEKVTNVVFMGMGEPFANYREVTRAIKILNDKELLNIGARKISISTIGVLDGINRLAGEKFQVNLAFSLHFADEETRGRHMPVNRTASIEKVMNALNIYFEKTGRRMMIEYVLLSGVNDSARHAEDLARLLKTKLRARFFVNLISYNSTADYKEADAKAVSVFKKILADSGIETVERYKFGRDIKGGCGQLAGSM